MSRRALRSDAYRDETIWTRARVTRDVDDSILKISDCSTYTLSVYDLTTEVLLYQISDGAPADVLSNAYRTSGWDKDLIGYNFAAGLSRNAWDRHSGKGVRIETILYSVDDGPDYIVHDVNLLTTWGP